MELWFIYALWSILFAGGASFLQKVAMEREYNSMLVSSLGMLASSLISITIVSFTTGFSGWTAGLVIGSLVGATYFIQSVLRLESLRNIDTAIFFPLYKTAAPIVAMVLGVIFFNEWFTKIEMFGLLVGLLVPLLLLHKSEGSRQKDLTKGIMFLLLAAVLAGVSSAIAKHGATLLSTIFLFMAVSDGLGGAIGMSTFLTKEGNSVKKFIKQVRNRRFISLMVISSFFQFGGYASLLYAFKFGGSLAIVYTINSFYILIPIVLSIIIYKEHWNTRKAFAIGLSIVALAFLG